MLTAIEKSTVRSRITLPFLHIPTLFATLAIIIMAITSSHIQLSNIRLYGHHGVSPQERRIGAWYSISLDLTVDIGVAALTHDELDAAANDICAQTDALNASVDYGMVADIVKREFCRSTMLLETLSHRIALAVMDSSPRIKGLTIHLSKLNPPVSVPTDAATIKLSLIR